MDFEIFDTEIATYWFCGIYKKPTSSINEWRSSGQRAQREASK